MAKSRETERGMVDATGWEVSGMGKLWFHGCTVPLWEDKNVQQVEGGDGHTKTLLHLVPLNWTCKMVNFM